VLEAYVAVNASHYLNDEYHLRDKFLKSNYYDKFEDPNTPKEIKERLQSIINVFSSLVYNNGSSTLKILIEKIDISQRFQ